MAVVILSKCPDRAAGYPTRSYRPVRELCVGGTHAAEKLTQLSICNDEIVENVVRNNEGVAHVGLRDVIPLLDLQR